MVKKRYIKRFYIEEAYCDKCGAPMRHTGMILTSYPAQYPFRCTNENCGVYKTFFEENRPGVLRYEYEEEESV